MDHFIKNKMAMEDYKHLILASFLVFVIGSVVACTVLIKKWGVPDL
jgi:hypothetical protein